MTSILQSERSQVLSLRLTEEEREGLAWLAEQDGLSQSDVLRQMLRARLAQGKTTPKRARGKSDGLQGRVEDVQLSGRTLVFDRSSNEPFMRLNGLLPLPVGAEIELVKPTGIALVTRVRLLAGSPTTLCLDVIRPDR